MFASLPKPKHVHDCSSCTFLGTYNGSDLYCCLGVLPTVIARNSSEGSDYASGECLGRSFNFTKTSHPSLRVAWLIAFSLAMNDMTLEKLEDID